MQVPDGAPLAGMAFHRVHGTEWSPVPGWAHEDPTERVLHRPSTPATLQLAAAAAHGARHFGETDPVYARRLLAAASTAYAAAARHPQLGASDDHARFGGGPYGDDDPSDDHYWAAAELWLVTGDETYLEDVRASPVHTADVFDLAGFDFDRVAGPARLDLALYGTQLPDHDDVRNGVHRCRRPAPDAAGGAAVGPAVRTGRGLGLGLQRAHPQQPRRPRRRPPAHRQPRGTPTA